MLSKVPLKIMLLEQQPVACLAQRDILLGQFGVDVVLPLPPARARAQIAEGFNRTSINKVCIIGSIWAPPLAAGQGPGSKSLGFG